MTKIFGTLRHKIQAILIHNDYIVRIDGNVPQQRTMTMLYPQDSFVDHWVDVYTPLRRCD